METKVGPRARAGQIAYRPQRPSGWLTRECSHRAAPPFAGMSDESAAPLAADSRAVGGRRLDVKKHHAKIAVSVNALVVLVLRKTRPDLLDVTDLIIVAVGIVGTVGKPSVFGDVFPSSVWESAFLCGFPRLRRFLQCESESVRFRETRMRCPNRVARARRGAAVACGGRNWPLTSEDLAQEGRGIARCARNRLKDRQFPSFGPTERGRAAFPRCPEEWPGFGVFLAIAFD